MTDTATHEPEAAGQTLIHQNPELTVPVWLRGICERYGERPALAFGEQTWSYARLGEEVSKLEATLLGLGVTKGTRVAIVIGDAPGVGGRDVGGDERRGDRGPVEHV